MSSWGRPTQGQHAEGRGTPLRSNTVRKAGNAADSKITDAETAPSHPSTTTRARRSVASASGHNAANIRLAARSSGAAVAHTSRTADAGSSSAVAHHDPTPRRGTSTRAYSPETKRRNAASRAAAAEVADAPKDLGPPSLRTPLRHTPTARQRVLGKPTGGLPAPAALSQDSAIHTVAIAKPPSTPSRPRPATGILQMPTESHTPSRRQQVVIVNGGAAPQRSSGGGYAQIHHVKSASASAATARPIPATSPPLPTLAVTAPDPCPLPATLQHTDTSQTNCCTPNSAGSIHSGRSSGSGGEASPSCRNAPGGGGARHQEGGASSVNGATKSAPRSGTAGSSGSGGEAAPGAGTTPSSSSTSSAGSQRRLSRGSRATPERSMVPAAALLSSQEPITPEAEAALAELKAEALSARRTSAGHSSGGFPRGLPQSDATSDRTLHRELSFKQADALDGSESDADSVALNVEMGSLAVHDVAQYAAESALASLEARIATMAGPAPAALGGASESLGMDSSTAAAAAALSQRAAAKVRGAGLGDIPLPRGNGLQGRPSSGQMRSSVAVGTCNRPSQSLTITAEPQVSANRKSGSRQSADRRADRGAAAAGVLHRDDKENALVLHKDDKEASTAVLAEMSDSKKNTLPSNGSSGGSLEQLENPIMGARCSGGGSSGLLAVEGGERVHSPPQSAVNEQWRARQLHRLQAAFRSALAEDVAALKAAVQQYREQVARLQCQKQLLLNQVLRLEALEEDDQAAQILLTEERDAAVADAASARAEAGAHMSEAAAACADAAAARAETAAMQEAATAAVQRHAAAPGQAEAPAAVREAVAAAHSEPWADTHAGTPRRQQPAMRVVPPFPSTPSLRCPPGLPEPTESPSRVHMRSRSHLPASIDVSDDSWASAPTVETLLHKIVELWERLHVPLVHRSRFFLAFRGREIFYYEAEHRRLAWLAKQLDPAADAEPVGDDVENSPVAQPAVTRTAQRKLDKALRRLEWERKFLAAQLKLDFDEEDKEELFLAWNVHRESKERKMQLVRKLWAPDITWDPTGMQRSSDLVMQLNGSEPSADTADDAYDMVFARSQGDNKWRSMLATGSTMLAPLLGRPTPRHSLLASPGYALKVDQRRSSSTFLGSFTNKLSRLSPGPSQLGTAWASNKNNPLSTGSRSNL